MNPGDRVRAALGIPWRGEYPHPTLVMGVVNVTPDSFQAEGRHEGTDAAVGHARALIAQGADILDIGGESTRPGAAPAPVSVEMDRVLPVVRALSGEGVPLSVDTRKAAVAEAALKAGAAIVNDISAGQFDPEMLPTVARAGAVVCLMHAPLDPSCMGWSTGNNPVYTDVAREVRGFLLARAEAAVEAGIAPGRIWLDPGFGFGKSVDDNLALLRRLDLLVGAGYPVLIGTSRKSTLGRVLGGAPPEERLEATLATVAMAAASGAAIVRVHDVAAAVRVARTADAILHPRGPNSA